MRPSANAPADLHWQIIETAGAPADTLRRIEPIRLSSPNRGHFDDSGVTAS